MLRSLGLPDGWPEPPHEAEKLNRHVSGMCTLAGFGSEGIIMSAMGSGLHGYRVYVDVGGGWGVVCKAPARRLGSPGSGWVPRPVQVRNY